MSNNKNNKSLLLLLHFYGSPCHQLSVPQVCRSNNLDIDSKCCLIIVILFDVIMELWSKVLQTGCLCLRIHSRIMCGPSLSFLLVHLPGLWKWLIAVFSMLHLVWNELPTDLCEPRQTQSSSLSPITHGSSSTSSPSSRSPLASSLTRSVFHSELKTWLSANHFLHRPYPFLSDWFHGLSYHLMFFLLNGWICLRVVLD